MGWKEGNTPIRPHRQTHVIIQHGYYPSIFHCESRDQSNRLQVDGVSMEEETGKKESGE